jgi:hypothetical protein
MSADCEGATGSDREVAFAPVSMDLYLWKAPLLEDTDEARRLLELDDESVFEPSPDLVAFFSDLTKRLPLHEAFTVEELEAGATPWADSPEASDRLVSLSIRWSAKDEDLETITELARVHGLVLYDPQGPALQLPGAEDWEPEPYSPTLGEVARALLLVAAGIVVGVGGWMLSIPVLSWILVFVGAFVALVAASTEGAVLYGAWRARRARSR